MREKDSKFFYKIYVKAFNGVLDQDIVLGLGAIDNPKDINKLY